MQKQKASAAYIVLTTILLSCNAKTEETEVKRVSVPITGTWELISGMIIENGDTTLTDYQKNQRQIKVINDTHFAFLNHDLHKGKDSAAIFVAGGGPYSLKGDQYTEHLEYCNYRDWEDHTFQFTVSVKNDTLIQSGVERIENLGVDRFNIEKYVRVKN